MTVSSSTSRNSYNGNGTTDTFAYTFRILDETHVAVYEDGVLKTITTHYTVTGVGDASGGNIVFVTPPVTGTLNVVFVRNVPITQETDYVENDPFPAASHEDALDKLTMIVQQQEEKFDRIPTLAVSSATSDLVFPDPSADKYLGWNSAGDELENKTLATVDAISLPVSIANGGTGQITAAAGLSALGGLPLAGGSMTGLLTLAAGADIASAATIDLTAATGNTVRVTGTTGTSALTMNAGQWMMLIADGAWPLTYHATTCRIITGADYTCTAEEVVIAHKDLSGVIHVWPSFAVVSQADAEAGTSTVPRLWTAERVAQAIAALAISSGGTLSTEQATSGSAAYNFTDVPSGTKRVVINFINVSTNGTAYPRIQLGDSGGIETSGYVGASSYIGTTNTSGTINLASGFDIATSTAANVFSGKLVLDLENATNHTWTASWVIGLSNTTATYFGAGYKDITTELTQISFTTANGTDTFDGGAVNVSYWS